MNARHSVMALALFVLSLPHVSAQPRLGAEPWPRSPLQRWDDPPIKPIRPLFMGALGTPSGLRLHFPGGIFGLPTMRSIILDPRASDSDREEALYHLVMCGPAAAPVLIEVNKRLAPERKWEVVLVLAIGGLMDRRLVPPLIDYARRGSTPVVQAFALDGLANYIRTRQHGGSLICDGGVIAYGIQLLPGDEKPIVRLYEEMKTMPDTMVRDRAKALEIALSEVLVEQRRLRDRGCEIP